MPSTTLSPMLLQFGRDICGNLAQAEQREWLVTNGIGGYASGTVSGLLTRHYHGLLVAALRPPLERTLLMTKLDETAIYGGLTYALNTDRWVDEAIRPQGHRHIERFTLEGNIPTWTYAFGDGLLTKRIWMEPGANTTYIRYRVERASAPVSLSLKALVNYRDHNHSTDGGTWKMQIQPVTHGFKVTAFDQATPFYLLSDGGTSTPQHTWYRGYYLMIERDRGIHPYDDHLHAATFEVTLGIGESLTVMASTEAVSTVDSEAALQRRRAHEQTLLDRWSKADYLPSASAPAWVEQLVLAADQFVVKRSIANTLEGRTVIAGYPWFGDWGRDTMIALPGLTIATGQPEIARPILQTFAQYIDQGMIPNLFPEAGEIPEYNTVDATLWYFEAIRAYYAATHDRALLADLFPALADIIEWHQRGTRYQIQVDSDGLLYAGEAGVQLTWMDAKVGDWVVTPRIGKPVEVNALWYNALLLMVQFAEELGQPSEDYQKQLAHTRQGFQRFWSDQLGYCYDLLDGPDGDDPTLRPNQIFAVSLPSTAEAQAPLSQQQQKAVVDVVARRLLTSHGLRSLDPDHPDYSGLYDGDRYQRDGQYHQGTVWGWLIGPFVQAHLRVYQNPEIARSFLAPMADHLRDGCIGSLSEIFDGDAPMAPRGTFAQAWTVSETLRAWVLSASPASFNPPNR